MKPFFETFPTLKINNPLRDIMEQTVVERVSASKKKDLLKVYLFSTRLVLKEDIWQAERAINPPQFSRSSSMSIRGLM